jgi:hypothetical protein
MSTQYQIALGYEINERSSNLTLFFTGSEDGLKVTNEEFTRIIIKQIEVLSYNSEDANSVLERFNVNYGDSK